MDDESTVVDTASLQLIVLGHLIQQEFSRLISLSEFLEGELNEEMDRRRVDAERLRGIGTEEEQGFNSVAIDDNLFEVERDFPRIVRYSLLMNLMSTTEACLVRLCHAARAHLGLGKEFNGRGSDVIQRAIEYLQVDANIDPRRGLRGYSKLAENLRNLRNAVTHSAGCIVGRHDESAIQEFANSDGGIEVDQRMYIILSDRFIGGNAHAMRTFLGQLHAMLRRMPGQPSSQ